MRRTQIGLVLCLTILTALGCGPSRGSSGGGSPPASSPLAGPTPSSSAPRFTTANLRVGMTAHVLGHYIVAPAATAARAETASSGPGSFADQINVQHEEFGANEPDGDNNDTGDGQHGNDAGDGQDGDDVGPGQHGDNENDADGKIEDIDQVNRTITVNGETFEFGPDQNGRTTRVCAK